ncbi:sulfur carrier protein ThiS [Thiomicrorhabdus sp. Kp2]|uniref:sulfur carrier protein ThiS n=1 Tax=Thiomicrorhabdus sp. Kp2 TaxID=1123518 RepID=UPI00040B1B3A|nr:sulfur carrier protein ThiS [Thiomicrorhabdus sp. Kp2]
MNIIINQQNFSFEEEINMTFALEFYKATPPFAVLLNDEFLPQSDYKATWLKDDDNIVVVGAIQGG